MERAYRENLAYIHDSGYGAIAIDAAQLLLASLSHDKLHQGMVVDLGCGGGTLARQAIDAGYAVMGIDISETFIRIARNRVPEADFRMESFVRAALPSCVAITAIGEVLNYSFDEQNGSQARDELFRRSFEALSPGGLLLFDMAVCEPTVSNSRRRTFREGPDWAVMTEVEVDNTARILTRRITSFRQVGTLYRRDAETHRLLLAEPGEILRALRSAGFQAQLLTTYGKEPLPDRAFVFLAHKPVYDAF
jgi:SAM-dependent methyltransferase